MRALAKALEDPDAEVASLMHTGFPLGWHGRLPRTPAMFERNIRWANHLGQVVQDDEWTSTYPSAEAALAHIR